MKNKTEIQERFLREEIPMRMGHLASDLARIASLINVNGEEETVKKVIEEAKFFSEWARTAGGLSIGIQTLLSEIQAFVAKKESEWEALSKNSEWRASVARQLRVWSEELLKKAGFLDGE